MNRLKIALLLLIGSVGTGVYAQEHSGMNPGNEKHIMVNTDKLEWMDAPAGLPKGAKVAVLEGNPSEAGPFTIRLQLPAGYEVKPHWHPAIEHVSVLKGEFFMGTGETFNKEKAMKLAEGGFAAMPAKYVHFAFTNPGGILQLHGIGPWGITYVNAKDDPRNSAQ